MKNKVLRVGKENNNFQRFEVIKKNRNKRHKYQEFFVEGVRNINEALKNGWEVKELLYSGEKKLSSWAVDILNTVKVDCVYEMTGELMQKLSSKEDTSELIAIIKMKDENINRIKIDKQPLIVVFDRPAKKGNLGTIIRSCDALGVDGLIMTGHAVDLYDPDTIASTVGSFFKLPVIRMASNEDVSNYVSSLNEKYNGIQVIGTSANTDTFIDKCDFTKPTVLLLGNETHGLNKGYREMCDKMVKIPIGGSASSLNVACAGSIVLYEVSRQRGL